MVDYTVHNLSFVASQPPFQIGPFIYKAVTIKDSVNMSNGESNLKYGEDGKTLTFRPR